MLEKNKDYVEFTLQCTTVERTRDKDYRQVCFNGYSDYDFPGVPMDVVCKEFDHKVVVVGKREFERLQANVGINEELAKQWEINYDLLLKKTGFDTVEELVFYLTNVAECETLQEAISKLKDQVKYTCDKWYSANSRNNSWKAAAECNSPKELIEKLNLLRDDISGHDTVIESYERNIKKWQKATGVLRPEDISAARALQEWKEATGCTSPSAAKTLIESGMSYEYAYHEAQKENRKLQEEVDELHADYSHLLLTTGFESEGEIEDALDKCDHSTLRKALVDYEFNYEALLKSTGYKSEHDIRVMLNNSEQFVYKDMRELINSLKRKVEFTESNWQNVTGFSTPEKCSSYIDTLEKKLEDIKDLIEED